MSEAGEKTCVFAEGILHGVARGVVANKGGTVVTAVMPKQAKLEGKGAVSNGLEKAPRQAMEMNVNSAWMPPAHRSLEYQYSPNSGSTQVAAAIGFSFRLQEPAEKKEEV
ncbi:hypothetical protein E2562_036859 [Oryza meyeriana var. granulata]|uniref:Uncharacterized protein n=1 Tax=Oryza meyeriana var. granulata TaxID=110450 RepID=A0A6G1ETH7_9ORYZ|nr:hypothetical protein E2562_036859 [Oryza meyeriana var. granulata]